MRALKCTAGSPAAVSAAAGQTHRARATAAPKLNDGARNDRVVVVVSDLRPKDADTHRSVQVRAQERAQVPVAAAAGAWAH